MNNTSNFNKQFNFSDYQRKIMGEKSIFDKYVNYFGILEQNSLCNISNYNLHCLCEKNLMSLKLLCMRIERELILLKNMQQQYDRQTQRRQMQKQKVDIEFKSQQIKKKTNLVFVQILYGLLWIIVVSVVISINISNLMIIDSSFLNYSPLYLLLQMAVQYGYQYIYVFAIYLLELVFILFGLNSTRLWNYYKLCWKGSDCYSFLFYTNRLTSLVFVLSWNLAVIFQVSQNTALYQVIGVLQQIWVFGLDLQQYLPIVIVVLFVIWIFHIDRFVMGIFLRRIEVNNPFATIKNKDTIEGEKILLKCNEKGFQFESKTIMKSGFEMVIGTIIDHDFSVLQVLLTPKLHNNAQQNHFVEQKVHSHDLHRFVDTVVTTDPLDSSLVNTQDVEDIKVQSQLINYGISIFFQILKNSKMNKNN